MCTLHLWKPSKYTNSSLDFLTMDPFTDFDLSQDEMKKLDEVLQSDHAKAILEETAVTHGATDVEVLMNTSIESTLSDLDILEPTISVANEVDVVHFASDIFCESVSKPLDSYILQEHSYSSLSLPVKIDIVEVINSEDTIKDINCQAIEICQTPPQVNGQLTPIEQSEKPLENKKITEDDDQLSVEIESSKSVCKDDLNSPECQQSTTKALLKDKLSSEDTIQQQPIAISDVPDLSKSYKIQIDDTKELHKVPAEFLFNKTDSKLTREVNGQIKKHIDLLDTSDDEIDDSVQALENAVVSMLSASVSSTDVLPSKNTSKSVRRHRVKSEDSKPISALRTIVNKKEKHKRRNAENSHFPVKASSKLSTHKVKHTLKGSEVQVKSTGFSVERKKLLQKRNISDNIPRKKSHSISEDKTYVKPTVEVKKRHLSASEKNISTDKMSLVKPKIKPRKRVVKNELITADLLGPALFSQPDVLVKVKTAEEIAEAKKSVDNAEVNTEIETASISDTGKKPDELIIATKDIEVNQKKSVSEQKATDDAAKPGAELLADLKSITPEEKNLGGAQSSGLNITSEESKNLPSKKPESPAVSVDSKAEQRPQRTLALRPKTFTLGKKRRLIATKQHSSDSSEEDDTSETMPDAVEESNKAQPPSNTPNTEEPKPGRKSLRTIQRKKQFDDDSSPERPARGRKKSNKNASPKTKEEVKEAKPSALKPTALMRRKSNRAAATTEEKSEESSESENDKSKNNKSKNSKSKNNNSKVDSEDSSEEYDSDDDPNKIWCICRKPHNNKFMIECDKCKDWFHGTCVNVTRQLGRQLEKQKKEWVCPNCLKTPALKKRTATTIEIETAANKAVKRQRNSLKKEVDSEMETSESKKNSHPAIKKDEIKPNGATLKVQSPPKETKPAKVLAKAALKKPANLDIPRNPIPKDFVLKSREPTRGTKRNSQDEKLPDSVKPEKVPRKMVSILKSPVNPEVKIEKIPVKVEKTPAKVEKTLAKVEKTPAKVEKLPAKFEKTPARVEKLPAKPEKTPAKVEKIPAKVEKIPAKVDKDPKPIAIAKSEGTKTVTDNALQKKKVLLREVTLVNNKIVKERSIVAVQHKIPAKGETNCQSNTGSLRNMNEKPKSVFKSSVLAIKEAKKESVRRRYQCVVCSKPAPSGSVYCSTVCLEKTVVDAIKFIQNSLKPNEELNTKKVDMIDRETGNFVTGPTAPTVAELMDWLKSNQMFSVVQPTIAVVNRKEPPIKSEPKASERSDDEESAKEGMRINVRKTLRKILFDRCANADDLKMSEEDVQKISHSIESELHNYLKDNSFKYRTKYRSLMFNIKDPRNQGLFRKILKGNIPPGELVRMSPEQLASVELAKWREKENQHALDMIKRMQTEQNQGVAGLRKKTHKGEIEIEDDANLGLDKPKPSIDVDKEVSKAAPKPVEETIEVIPEKKEKIEEKETEKDSTMMHRSHLFDLNCKICTGKMAPPPPEETTPKKIRVAHSISIEQTSPLVPEMEVRSIAGRTSISEQSDDSIDRESLPTTFGSPDSGSGSRKSESSLWKGFIMMQDVAKFFSSAHKVSGTTDALFTDIPDNLQVCGRINPQQVWDYLSKVKQSGRQELVIVSFRPSSEEEAKTYNVFYNYLNSRKRCGVVNQNYSKLVKDFYILPLAAHTPVPTVLLPFDGPGLPSHRPHLLLGVLVRHRSKQKDTHANINQEKSEESFTPPREGASYTPPLDNRTYTSPLDSSSNTPPEKHAFTPPPIAERSYTPPLDKGSYTPPLEERSYTPPLEDKSYIPTSDRTQNNTVTSTFSEYRSKKFKVNENMEAYEPSYTPPLDGIPKPSRSEVNERPYKPIPITTDVSGYRASDSGNNVISEFMRKLKENSIPPNSGTPNLERQKGILNDLISKVQEVDLKMSQSIDDFEKLKAISQDKSDVHGNEVNNVVSSAGMSSFLTMPKKNLQDILDSVKPKSELAESSILGPRDTDIRCFPTTLDSDIRSLMGDKDTDIRTLPNYSPVNPNDPESPDYPMDDVDDRGSSQDGTPPLCDDEISTTTQELRPSDPRIKIRTNFTTESSPSDEQKKRSLSNMSTSELVEKAQKELEAITPPAHFSVPNWNNCKEPPPPGIDPSDLSPAERVPFQRSSIPSVGLLPPPLADGNTVTSPFATTPPTPSAFAIPPPGYPLHSPAPPAIPVNTSFPPPGFIPPPNVLPPIVPAPDGRDERNDPYFQWHPEGQPTDMEYHDRPSQWDEREFGDWDHRHGDRPPSDGWFRGRGHASREHNNTPWRHSGRGLRRWATRRTRHNNWRRRASFSRPPRE